MNCGIGHIKPSNTHKQSYYNKILLQAVAEIHTARANVEKQINTVRNQYKKANTINRKRLFSICMEKHQVTCRY